MLRDFASEIQYDKEQFSNNKISNNTYSQDDDFESEEHSAIKIGQLERRNTEIVPEKPMDKFIVSLGKDDED